MQFFFNAAAWVALTTWVFYLSAIATFFLAYIFVRDDKNGRCDGFPFFPSLFIAGVIYLATIRYDSTGVLFSWPNILYTIGGYLLIGFFVSLFKWIRKLSNFKKFASDLKSSMGVRNAHSKLDEQESFSKRLTSEYGYNDIGEIDGKFYLKPQVSSLTRHWIYWPFFLISVLVDPIYDLVNLTVTLLKGFYLNLAKKFAV